jgi:hypothetical protein
MDKRVKIPAPAGVNNRGGTRPALGGCRPKGAAASPVKGGADAGAYGPGRIPWPWAPRKAPRPFPRSPVPQTDTGGWVEQTKARE